MNTLSTNARCPWTTWWLGNCTWSSPVRLWLSVRSLTQEWCWSSNSNLFGARTEPIMWRASCLRMESRCICWEGNGTRTWWRWGQPTRSSTAIYGKKGMSTTPNTTISANLPSCSTTSTERTSTPSPQLIPDSALTSALSNSRISN